MILRNLMFCAICASVPAAAQAESLLALPSETTGLTLWATTELPAPARFTEVAGGTEGACYVVDQATGSLRGDSDQTACLSYLIREGFVSRDGADPYAISGQIAFMHEPLGELYKGFKIVGVSGVDYCGERDGCDEIFIQGVTTPALLAPMIAAARSGATVSVTGAGVWNIESIDIVIDSIR